MMNLTINNMNYLDPPKDVGWPKSKPKPEPEPPEPDLFCPGPEPSKIIKGFGSEIDPKIKQS